MTIKTRIETEANYRSVWCNGKTIRFAIDPSKPITELKYPEFYDIKVTGNCEGKCPYCYMDSNPETHYENIVEKTRNFFSIMDQNQLPYQVACLEENTLVYTKNGCIEIKNIKVGDYVYNEEGKLVKVINVINNQKECIELKGNKGFKIICTPDHLFQSNNKLEMAENLKGKKLDTGHNVYFEQNTTKDDFIIINEINNVGVKNVVDITLEEGSSHLFTVSHGVITHNCGGGEPTSHPDFVELLRVLKEEFDICPNYTTNGMWSSPNGFVTDKEEDIITATAKYCGGVAVSCHPHLKEYWATAAQMYSEAEIRLNFHIIISDKESIDYFKEIYNEWKDKVEYFVLLPYGNQGRAEHKEIDWEYLIQQLPEQQNQIAFGANFYPYLLKGGHNIKVALYEPEIMSKFLDLKDMKIYPSSFNLIAK